VENSFLAGVNCLSFREAFNEKNGGKFGILSNRGGGGIPPDQTVSRFSDINIVLL
jgi:hypothetical protein